jgi:hypothetical protein
MDFDRKLSYYRNSRFFFNQPNRWSIQAFTDVELFDPFEKNYLKLCQEFPKWLDIEKDSLSNVLR